jgi:hypothetical protein
MLRFSLPEGASYYLDASHAVPAPLSQIFTPIPLDNADAVIDANGTQRISVDFAGYRNREMGSDWRKWT